MKVRKLTYSEEYTNKNGEKKTIWHDCGTLFLNEDTKNISIKLTAFPISGQMMAFVPKPKEEQTKIEPPKEEAPLDDLPF